MSRQEALESTISYVRSLMPVGFQFPIHEAWMAVRDGLKRAYQSGDDDEFQDACDRYTEQAENVISAVQRTREISLIPPSDNNPSAEIPDSENSEIKITVTHGSAPLALPLTAPLAPCPKCQSPIFWHSIYRDGIFRCLECERPPARNLILRKFAILIFPAENSEGEIPESENSGGTNPEIGTPGIQEIWPRVGSPTTLADYASRVASGESEGGQAGGEIGGDTDSESTGAKPIRIAGLRSTAMPHVLMMPPSPWMRARGLICATPERERPVRGASGWQESRKPANASGGAAGDSGGDASEERELGSEKDYRARQIPGSVGRREVTDSTQARSGSCIHHPGQTASASDNGIPGGYSERHDASGRVVVICKQCGKLVGYKREQEGKAAGETSGETTGEKKPTRRKARK